MATEQDLAQAEEPNALSRRRFLRLGVYVAPIVLGGAYLIGTAGPAAGQSEESGGGSESGGCSGSGGGSESAGGGGGPTVVIDGVDTGVPNVVGDDGCTISDQIAAAAASAANHGEFVSAVAGLTNGLKSAGVISKGEKGAIQRVAAQANIP
jgi:hypothetical protein